MMKKNRENTKYDEKPKKELKTKKYALNYLQAIGLTL